SVAVHQAAPVDCVEDSGGAGWSVFRHRDSAPGHLALGRGDPVQHEWGKRSQLASVVGGAGGPDCGMAAMLVYLSWRPLRAPAVVQWIALAVIVFLTANVPFVGPAVALVAVPVVLVLVAYPAPRDLLTPPWIDGFSPPRLAVGTLVAVV